MTARSKRGKKPRVVSRRRASPPLTDMQRKREHLLIDLGVSKAEIARAVGDMNRSVVTAIFRDKFRSLGPDGIEQRIVDFLRKRAEAADSDEDITRESLGWPEPPEDETRVVASA